MRKGGALSLALAGVEDHVVKAMGRWKPECYGRYIESVACEVKDAQVAMSSLWDAAGPSNQYTAEDVWDRLA